MQRLPRGRPSLGAGFICCLVALRPACPLPCLSSWRQRWTDAAVWWMWPWISHLLPETSAKGFSPTRWIHAFVMSVYSPCSVWHCWLEEHPACKNWLMRCWCSYLSGARGRSFAYGPADASASTHPHNLLPHLNPDWFIFLVPAYPGCPGKKAVKRV